MDELSDAELKQKILELKARKSDALDELEQMQTDYQAEMNKRQSEYGNLKSEIEQALEEQQKRATAAANADGVTTDGKPKRKKPAGSKTKAEK